MASIVEVDRTLAKLLHVNVELDLAVMRQTDGVKTLFLNFLIKFGFSNDHEPYVPSRFLISHWVNKFCDRV